MSNVPDHSLRDMAIDYAAGAVVSTFDVNAGSLDLYGIARDLIRVNDPLHCAGINSAGAEILFDYSFGYEDLADITARAQAILNGADA